MTMLAVGERVPPHDGPLVATAAAPGEPWVLWLIGWPRGVGQIRVERCIYASAAHASAVMGAWARVIARRNASQELRWELRLLPGEALPPDLALLHRLVEADDAARDDEECAQPLRELSAEARSLVGAFKECDQ